MGPPTLRGTLKDLWVVSHAESQMAPKGSGSGGFAVLHPFEEHLYSVVSVDIVGCLGTQLGSFTWLDDVNIVSCIFSYQRSFTQILVYMIQKYFITSKMFKHVELSSIKEASYKNLLN